MMSKKEEAFLIFLYAVLGLLVIVMGDFFITEFYARINTAKEYELFRKNNLENSHEWQTFSFQLRRGYGFF